MRSLVLVPFLGAVMWAQAPPPQDPDPAKEKPPAAAEPGKPGDDKPEVKRQDRVPAPAPRRPCAIPLTNLLRPSPAGSPIRRIPIPDRKQAPMKEVPLPAPSCDDVKK